MEQLRMLRETKGMSQAKLAVLADMNPVTLWRYETGQRSPTVEQLERLAGVLGLEVADFFPKEQGPLPLEDDHTSTVFEDSIAGLAGWWLERLEDLHGRSDDLAIALAISTAAGTLQDNLLYFGDHEDKDEEAEQEQLERAYRQLGRLPVRQGQEVMQLLDLLGKVRNKAHAVFDREGQKDDGNNE